MSTVLFVFLGAKITTWKIVGFSGTFLFTSRWIVQVVASRRAERPTLPKLFWYMSILGSTLLLTYFVFGKNDAVGIVSNGFPLTLAIYNLFLELRRPPIHRTPTTNIPGEAPAEVV